MAAFTNQTTSSTVLSSFSSSSLSTIPISSTSSSTESTTSSSFSSSESTQSSSSSTTSFDLTTSTYTSQNQIVTVTVTRTSDVNNNGSPTSSTDGVVSSTSISASSSSTPTIAGSQSHSSSSSLSTGGKIGVGIGVPVAVIGLACLLLLLFFRHRRKARARAARLQEVQDYGFNPNDPSGPYHGGDDAGVSGNKGFGMSEVDGAGAGTLASGYRGWGPDSPNPSGGSNNHTSSVATKSPSAPSAAGLSPVARAPQHAPTDSDTSAFDLPPPIPPMAPRRMQARNSQQFVGSAAAHARSSSFPQLNPSQTSGSVASSASGTSGTNGNGNGNGNGHGTADHPDRYSPPPVLRNVAAIRTMKVESGQNTGISANF
ncbi:uncharacterized protein V1513DRAFT_439983 [Lipomyces chichibuensis]|uniref:uncharacterized protein n=1 Tax=Lipomyces chichibuensis TaxID=1546026 RepID=UPI0033431C6C